MTMRRFVGVGVVLGAMALGGGGCGGCGNGAGTDAGTDAGGGDTDAAGTDAALPTWDPADPAPGEWPMFKRALDHTGVADEMTGAITAATACVKWERPVVGLSARTAGGPVIANVGGTWTVFVGSDGLCETDGTGCTNPADGGPGAAWALDGATGSVLWRTVLPGTSQADPYAPVVADVDADGRRELVMPSTNSNLLWAFTTEDEGAGAGAIDWTFTYAAGETSENAPVAVNLDPSDPELEILFGNAGTGGGVGGTLARVLVIDGADGTLKSAVELDDRMTIDAACPSENKADSSCPAVALVGGELRAYIGAWNGGVYALRWGASGLEVAYRHDLPLEPAFVCPVGKVRSSPAVADLTGDGSLEVVFGYMYEEDDVTMPGYQADLQRFAEGTLRAMDAETGAFVGELVVGDWKSSPSVAELDAAEPGHEIAAGRLGGVFVATSAVTVGFNVDLSGPPRGGNRSSPALADIDGDGDLDMLLGIESDNDVDDAGVFAFSPEDGSVLWAVLAPPFAPGQGYRGASSSPAVGDIDGDGSLEVVILGADGMVRAIDSACP